GFPARLDDDGLVRLDDDRRAFDFGADLELVAGIDVGLVPRAARIEARRLGRLRQFRRRAPRGFLRELGAAADGLNRNRLDDQFLVAIDEAEARLVRLLEG